MNLPPGAGKDAVWYRLLVQSVVFVAWSVAVVLIGGLGACDDEPREQASSTSGGGGGSGPILSPDVEACVRINACDADGGTPVGMQICLGYELDVAWEWATVGPARLGLEARRCKLAAATCDAVRACTPPAEPYADRCTGLAGLDFCDGDTWVYCDDAGKPLAAMDCGAEGLACSSDFYAGCGAEPCDYATDQAKCDEAHPDVLLECSPAGFWRQIDCRSAYNLVSIHGTDGDEDITIAGETCGYDAMRGANSCVGTGNACTFFSQACKGDVLETCAGGKLARRDCAAITEPTKLGCGFEPSGAATCGLVGGACSMDDAEQCEGGIVHFCAFGAKADVDCKALGYGGCATGKQGGRHIAYCSP